MHIHARARKIFPSKNKGEQLIAWINCTLIVGYTMLKHQQNCKIRWKRCATPFTQRCMHGKNGSTHTYQYELVVPVAEDFQFILEHRRENTLAHAWKWYTICNVRKQRSSEQNKTLAISCHKWSLSSNAHYESTWLHFWQHTCACQQ